ncbi:MAG: recombination mediator RecR [Armatimonadetes bacterium]|nr:recombination mediator RecR [Armatimonadota bacterium]
MYYARSLARLIGELEKLPNIGPKTAQRLAFHLLRAPREDVEALADAMVEVKENIGYCEQCFNFTDQKLCEVCRDPRRDPSMVCVVSDPRDLVAIEKTNSYRGLYHVLHGVINPMEGIGPEQLRVRELLGRLQPGSKIEEVILALNPTIEGDATSLYLMKLLKNTGAHVSQIAHGLPMGGEMDYADQATLIQSLAHRRRITEE